MGAASLSHLLPARFHPDQLVRAAANDSLDAVALLVELAFDVNAMGRTVPLHEAAMRGNLAMIELLLAHGADPNLHDKSYDAPPADWAEHHGQIGAQQYLARSSRRRDSGAR